MRVTTVTTKAALLGMALFAACVASPLCAAEEEEAPVNPWQDYVAKGNWQQGETYFRDEIIAECLGGRSYKRLSELHNGYNICRYFPAMSQRTLSEAEQLNLRNWLLANQDFTEEFLLALDPADDTARAFEVLYQILEKYHKRVGRYPDLAIAFCVVWDNMPAGEMTVQEAFDYFTESSTQTTFNLRTMPWQASKYLVDTQLAREERKWAQKQYSRTSNIGRLYDKIYREKYDTRAFLRGEPKKISEHEYTLENIRRYGGVCHDAAVFASEIGKNIGVPSAYITGPSPSGIAHAWIGYLRRSSGGYKWDKDTGRLGDDDVTQGRVRDPQTGAMVPEHELDFAVTALARSSSDRHKAQRWAETALMVAEARGGQGADDRKAAADYAMNESLSTCVFHKSQWIAYGRLARLGVFSSADIVKTADGLADKLEDYPDLAIDAFEELLASAPGLDANTKSDLCDDLARKFRRNDHATARVRLTEGQLLEMAGQPARAAEVYGEAVEDALKTALAVPLLDNAGRILVDTGKLVEAIDLHKEAFRDARTPRSSAYVTFSTWFRIGSRLAALHALAGDEHDHESTLRKITKQIGGDSDDRDGIRARLERSSYGQINTTRAPRPRT